MFRRLAVAALVSLPAAPAHSLAAQHPLDALSAAEIQRAVSVLRQSNHLTPAARFGTITVQPREKSRERNPRRAHPGLRLVEERRVRGRRRSRRRTCRIVDGGRQRAADAAHYDPPRRRNRARRSAP